MTSICGGFFLLQMVHPLMTTYAVSSSAGSVVGSILHPTVHINPPPPPPPFRALFITELNHGRILAVSPSSAPQARHVILRRAFPGRRLKNRGRRWERERMKKQNRGGGGGSEGPLSCSILCINYSGRPGWQRRGVCRMNWPVSG